MLFRSCVAVWYISCARDFDDADVPAEAAEETDRGVWAWAIAASPPVALKYDGIVICAGD